VPDLKGLDPDIAKKMLKNISLEVGDINYEYSEEEPGTVIGAYPESGKEVKCNQKVDLIISRGAEQTEVPDIVGSIPEGAQTKLAEYGLILGYIKTGTDNEKSQGVILKQYPAKGKKVPRGTSITVIVNNIEDNEK
jgi:serine/threonine-protein kinase